MLMTPDTTTTVDAFVRLFRGRGDAYGHDEGRCVKAKIEREHWVDHLNGTEGMGVYPAVPTPDGPKCVWGCTDIDVEDYSQALLLQATLEQAAIVSWIERSRSKGYHVWIFVDRPIDAGVMRNMQLVAHQVCDLPPKEVNPKQTDVSLTKYGNYVRLPYLGGIDYTPERRVILDINGAPMPLVDFVREATLNINTPDIIRRVASMYQPPAEPPQTINMSDPSADLSSSLRQINGLGYVVWRDGPLQGYDRSNTLMKLAHLCYESGMTASQAQMVVRDADRRWGKFHGREDCDEQIGKIIRRAYE
jgi:hypothetical protein